MESDSEQGSQVISSPMLYIYIHNTYITQKKYFLCYDCEHSVSEEHASFICYCGNGYCHGCNAPHCDSCGSTFCDDCMEPPPSATCLICAERSGSDGGTSNDGSASDDDAPSSEDDSEEVF